MPTNVAQVTFEIKPYLQIKRLKIVVFRMKCKGLLFLYGYFHGLQFCLTVTKWSIKLDIGHDYSG